jgi:DNA-directed DNA polymerase III PolC
MIRVRTGYSFRSAAGGIEDVMSRLQECDYPAAPITDRSSTFGWVKWSKLAKKNGLKPVFGVELAVTDSIHAKKPAVDYWTFIAHDSLRPLNQLIETATEQFRYEPLLTYAQAQDITGVSRIIGSRSLLEHVMPSDDIHVSLAPSSSKGYIRAALAKGLIPVAASDNKYARREDQGFYEIVCGRGASVQTYDQHIQTPAEWAQSVARLGLAESCLKGAFAASAAILERSTAQLELSTLLKPERFKTLRQMCIEGAEKMGVNLQNPIYAERLDRELNLIAEKDFEDYFYIVADICLFARERMIVGPARGSSCGSLVCYLLRITTIDPIPYNLIFERFIDINRNDLPDIDIDFSDQQRHLVFEYLNQKYGSDRVARLGTVAMFKPRSAMQEAAGALRIPKWKTEAVADSLIERSSGDARALNTLEDTLTGTPTGQRLIEDYPEMMIAARMEGHPRHSSQHAAGIIICSEPIKNYVAVDHRTGSTMCDKYDAEALNFLKIDALGLTQLSVFENALEMARIDYSVLESIPMDDREAFKVLNDRKFSGIFQFNGLALKRVANQLKSFDRFDDIVSLTALARPGPLASGGTDEWVNRRNGYIQVSFPHEIFEPYLKDTYGVVIYQEQVMEIARNIGGLSWGDVTSLRKAMSKSLGKEFFDQYGDPWKKGAIEKGVSSDVANKVWDDLCAYGAWSFNKSHSVAYGLISYQCCWLKAHYPFEFAAATLTHETDPNNQIMLLREMRDEGFGYVPVDKNFSTDRWSVGWRDGGKVLLGPLSNVKGVGPKMVSSVLAARARKEKIPERAEKLLHDPKTSIDSLFPIRDAFQRVMPDPSERNILSAPLSIADVLNKEKDSIVLVFCILDKITLRNENETVLVAKRGYEIKDGKTSYLNLLLRDDTGQIFGKINRYDFEKLGKEISDRGGAGKHLYAIKGTFTIWGEFRMIKVNAVRYVGE